MFTRTIKTATIAAVVLLATASASFAAQYAWVDHDAKVKFKPKNSSQTVNYVEEGQKVRIIAHSGSWVKIKIPGDDGWVKASALDYGHYYDADYYDYGYSGSASVCLGSPHVSFCVGN
jgi:SH3-like domain-containing protein